MLENISTFHVHLTESTLAFDALLRHSSSDSKYIEAESLVICPVLQAGGTAH